MGFDTALVAALSAALSLAGLTLPGGEPDSPVAIEGADEATRSAILEVLPKRDAPQTLFEAERIAEEAAERARAWLRSEGYYAAEIKAEAFGEPARAQIVISPGRRFLFEAPDLRFDDSAPETEGRELALVAMNGIGADAPARAADVLNAENAIVAALQGAGYPDAKAGERRVVVDHANNRVRVTFHLMAGERARLGAVRMADNDDYFRQALLDRVANWSPGDVFTPRRLGDLRRDIIATGTVTHVSTELAAPDENGLRDVLLSVEPAKRNAYEVGLGWSTTEGVAIEAERTRRNFSHRADAFTIATELGEQNRSLTTTLERPHASGRRRTQRFVAEIEREDNDAFTREGISASASVDASPTLRFGASYGASLAFDRYGETAGVENALVGTTYVELRRNSVESPLDARSGSILQTRLEPSVSSGDATLGFLRTSAEARVYRSFSDNDRYTLAARTRAGWVEAVAGDAEDIPADRRFYAGGGGSVRGYDYNSIYPDERDTLNLTPGGQGLLELGAEARARIGERWGAVAFVDGGNAFDDLGDAGRLQWGAGIGARYDLGFAPLRIDLAFPLNGRERDPDFALYISLGQAF